MAKATVIVSTFDQPNALRLCLEGYARQSSHDFELIISDDGSDDETRGIIEDFRRHSPFKVGHVWQENKGYRRARVHNMAALQATGSILIFSDGDTVPNKNFVSVHMNYCRPKSFCIGGYVKLGPDESNKVLEQGVNHEELLSYVTFRYRYRFLFESVGFCVYQMFNRPDRVRVYGANISARREDFVAINGFDENYDNFGREDSDLRNRLILNGCRPVSVWGKTWVYHLDDAIDPKIKRRRIPRRRELERLYYYRKLHSPRCENGMFKSGSLQT